MLSRVSELVIEPAQTAFQLCIYGIQGHVQFARAVGTLPGITEGVLWLVQSA